MEETNQQRSRLFVGGVNNATTGVGLRSYFEKYGQVKDAFIVKCKETRLSRGFGYVEFEDPSAAHRALQHQHFILGKKVDVYEAELKKQDNVAGDSNRETCDRSKIFVGGLPPTITPQEFRSFFEKFGAVNDAILVRDKLSGRPKGFGFVTFESKDSADTALENENHQLNGWEVQVKRANPRNKKTPADVGYCEPTPNIPYIYVTPDGCHWYYYPHPLPAFNYPCHQLPSNCVTGWPHQSYTEYHRTFEIYTMMHRQEAGGQTIPEENGIEDHNLEVPKISDVVNHCPASLSFINTGMIDLQGSEKEIRIAEHHTANNDDNEEEKAAEHLVKASLEHQGEAESRAENHPKGKTGELDGEDSEVVKVRDEDGCLSSEKMDASCSEGKSLLTEQVLTPCILIS